MNFMLLEIRDIGGNPLDYISILTAIDKRFNPRVYKERAIFNSILFS